MSYIGQSPAVKRIRHTPQSTTPSNPMDGDVFYSDGTSRAEGLWAYVNGGWLQLSTGGLQSQAFTGNGNFTVPDGVNNVLLFGVGGGGGGGGGGGSTAAAGGGGAGGNGSKPELITVAVTPGETVAIVIGSGGTAGAAGAANGNGSAGGRGTNTTFGSTRAVFVGAWGGAPGLSAGNGGTGGRGYFPDPYNITGGIGSDDQVSATTDGERSTLAAGGAGGGTGGGGGAGRLVGGAGGNGGNPGGSLTAGTAAAANSGAGGGGGGSATNATQPGAAGGAGGSGHLLILW